MTTFEVWRGESRTERRRYSVALLTVGSDNVKTGDAVSVAILDAEHDPVTAYAAGRPSGCSPDCSMSRDGLGCYVNWGQAPLGLWRAWHAGNVEPLRPEGYAAAMRGRALLRLGSAGDPAAMPPDVVAALVTAAKAEGLAVTAYTHDHRRQRSRHLRSVAMASVENAADAAAARRRGWRTFRIDEPGMMPSVDVGEIVCPASAERGYVTTCNVCKVCGPNGAAVSVAIAAHGATGWSV